MSLDLRARAATALLELAFNPHQRRGPDGRWIKMQTNELKRPRRPKKPKADKAKPDAVKAPSQAVKTKPEARTASDVPPTRLTPSTEEPAEQMRERLTRSQRVAEAMFGPNRTRWPADERAAIALLEHAIAGRLEPGSDQPQVLIPNDFPNYRRDRDEYNATVIDYAVTRQAKLKADGHPDGSLQFYIDSAIEGVRDYDPAEGDEMVNLLRAELDMAHDGRGMLPFAPEGAHVDERPLAVLPPGQRTPGGSRPPVADRYEERREALDRSVRSGIVDQDLFSNGAMGDTRRVILADGTDAIYKRAKSSWMGSGWGVKEQTDAEELGALVAAAVGVRAPAIQRADETSLYMEVMPGKIAAERGMAPAPQRITDSPQGMRMGLLDVLLNNSDRHAGNWMVDPDDQIAAIDHGLAFRKSNVERSIASMSPFTGLFVDGSGDYQNTNPLTRRDVEQVRSDLERIRPRFEELGRADWFDQVTQRLDRLAARASGYRPLLEDAPTMLGRRAAAAMAVLEGGKP